MAVPAGVREDQAWYYNDLMAGNVFWATNVIAGVALTANAATTQNYGVINPSGSGKNLIPIAFLASFRGTTGTEGSFVFNYATGINYPAATGAACTTFTAVDTSIVNGLLGSGNRSVAHFAAAAASIVLASAPTFLGAAGIGFNVITDASATNMPYQVGFWFESVLAVTPGALFIACGSATDATLWNQTLIWAERPAVAPY